MRATLWTHFQAALAIVLLVIYFAMINALFKPATFSLLYELVEVAQFVTALIVYYSIAYRRERRFIASYARIVRRSRWRRNFAQ